ncbi:dynein regulatory complex protein 10 [Vombatus ursinus]|uniref:Dynein regulatory complex protein 10 n=1 Tax=Vombatus ursinus TaxID=29139 RepID=A0A4X2K1X6_VOMUR|nr:dynein regulatory complex protein 10 [Vombatus ursinus]XP_027719392.1 dynein regulatory complex protein 10 [Vombatus ursinus]
MAMEVIVAPLYQGSEISTSNRLRLAMGPASKKALLSCTATNQMDPARTKLTTIEAKKIIFVLDETIRKVEMVTLLSAAACNLESLEGLCEDDVIKAVRDHEDFCHTLLELDNLVREEQEQLAESGDHGQQLLLEEHKRNLTLLKEEVKGSARNTLRIFLRNLPAGEVLCTQVVGRSEEANIFLQGLIEFRGFVFEKLLTSPMEEKEKAEFLEEINLQEKKNKQLIQDLEAELGATLKARDSEMEKENSVIQELKSHLHQVLKFSENHLLRTKQEAEKQQKAELQASQGRIARIQQDILRLRTQYHNVVEENRDSEQALRKKKYKLETEIENWIQKYDTEMGEKQTEYEELDEIYTEEKAQLAELKEKYAVLVQEFVQIRDERVISSKKKLEAEKEMALMMRAASLIQAFWRGYLVRSLLKSKWKKKKGRGRKKK